MRVVVIVESGQLEFVFVVVYVDHFDRVADDFRDFADK